MVIVCLPISGNPNLSSGSREEKSILYTPQPWRPTFLSGSGSSMVHTLSGPMVYNLFPCFP